MTDTGDEFASNGYSRDSFYVTATDDKGHSSKVRISVPPSLKGQLSALIASKVLPMYRTEEDFHRDAIVHRLHDVTEMMNGGTFELAPDMAAIGRAMEALSTLEMYNQRIADDQAMAEKIESLLRYVNTPEAIATFNNAASFIGDPRLRSRVQDEIARYDR